MAEKITAVNALRPRLKRRGAAPLEMVDEHFSACCNLPGGAWWQYSAGVLETVVFFLTSGYSVKIPGMGVFYPTLDKNGDIKMKFQQDRGMPRKLNTQTHRRLKVKNRQYLKYNQEQLCEAWNELYPDDPVRLEKKEDNPEVPSSGCTTGILPQPASKERVEKNLCEGEGQAE